MAIAFVPIANPFLPVPYPATGVATAKAHAESIAKIQSRADQAMYVAKREGRNV